MADFDRFLDKAYAYRKTGLWKYIVEDEPFALQLSGGRIGYISLMGADGNHCAAALYIGESGLRSLLEYLSAQQTEDPVERISRLTASECLQCVLTVKRYVPDSLAERVRAYARDRGMRLSGANAFALPWNCKAYSLPVVTLDAAELDDLCEMLDALAWVDGQCLSGKWKIEKVSVTQGKWPLLEKQGDGYAVREVSVPWPFEPAYPSGDTWDGELLKQVTAIRGRGSWPIRLTRVMHPLDGDIPGQSVYPMLVVAVFDVRKSLLLRVQPVIGYDEHPERALNALMNAMIAEDIRPRELIVTDDRTQALLARWCLKCGILLVRRQKSEADEAALQFLQSDRSDLMDELLTENNPTPVEYLRGFCDAIIREPSLILSIDEEDKQAALKTLTNPEFLAGLPDPLRKKCRLAASLIQDSLSAQKNRRARGRGGKKKNAKAQSTSFVVSVSLEKGCYRHIRISSAAKLEELSDAILDAFGFDNDHLHAFFMDNRAWSAWDSYYAEETEEEDRFTCDYTLREAGVRIGKAFKYIFDFGDEWIFQCKTLRELPEPTPEAITIRSVGDAPEQYGDWDDEDWEDENEDEDEDEGGEKPGGILPVKRPESEETKAGKNGAADSEEEELPLLRMIDEAAKADEDGHADS